MNILILGSGGREHALSWKISQSSSADTIYIAPGNAGTCEVGINLDIDISDFDLVKREILDKDISLVVVGPEAPLVAGITDYLNQCTDLSDLMIIGAGTKGAMLEGSKDFAKNFMDKHGIPTASYQTFTSEKLQEGKEFLKTLTPPYVLKADGLAAGKGVVIPNTIEEAEEELESMLKGKFGKASTSVVIEEFLQGIELSVFVMTDGHSWVLLPEAKDYKRIGEGDSGLNTGGMGAVSPVPFADESFMNKVKERIIEPTIEGLQKDKIPYKGFIFIGLMNVEGDPFVIEYNVRLGDPESEVILPRIKSDFLEALTATAKGELNEKSLEFDEQTAVTVMMVSGGYPGSYEKGKIISGLDQVKDSLLFHAGTRLDKENILTNGGRVIAVTSFGNEMKDALNTSYKNVEKVKFDDKYCRKDIGFDL